MTVLQTNVAVPSRHEPLPLPLREIMRSWTTGVAVMTAHHESQDVGMVSNSLVSVSMEPPLVSWCVDRRSSAFGAWSLVDEFAVHVLSSQDRPLVDRFAARGGDKYAGLEHARGLSGVPLLSDFLVRLRCRTWARVGAGDHLMLLGLVLDVATADGAPMLVSDLW